MNVSIALLCGSTRRCPRNVKLRIELGVCGCMEVCRPTEDKLLSTCQHVQRERDFILVALALEPAEQRGWVQHCGEKEGERGA
jgi:hypothetical protein